VRATIEVQVEARKVVKENKRLRELLRQVGVEDEAVERWAKEGEGDKGERDYVERKDDGMAAEDCGLCVRSGGNTQTGNESYTESPATTNDASATNPSPSTSSLTCSSSSQKKCDRPPSASTSATTCQPPSLILPPCKLLTHLSINPSADLLQLPLLPPESQPPSSSHKPLNDNNEEEEPGIPCTQAYLMFTQYATSEEKLDEVARILEEGCVRDKKGGGCRVRINEAWRGLDGCVGG
jgi:hypothetical protein